jgi:RHS repeat-associated protein
VLKHYGFDAHGNITFLTDASGAVTASYDYDAWGNLVASTGSTPNTRLYVGEELDPDLGLLNLRARQYRPATGRFLTIDPLMGNVRKPRTLNRYLYTSVDPVNGSDPTGQIEILSDLAILKADLQIANSAAWALFATKQLLGYGAKKVVGKDPFSSDCALFTGAAGAFIDVGSAYSVGGMIALASDIACDLISTFSALK